MTFKLEVETERNNGLRLALLVNDDVLWPHPDSQDGAGEFSAEDVLSYLCDSWASLLLAWNWPISFDAQEEPRSVTGLQRAAESRWARLSDDALIEKEAELLDQFLYTHDFSQMKFGAGLQACFVLREYSKVRIETFGKIIDDIDFPAFLNELAELGHVAAAVVAKRSDSTAQSLLKRWESREKYNALIPAALISGMSIADIENNDSIARPLVREFNNRPISEIANDNKSPLLAAARTSGALGPRGLSEVLSLVQGLPDGHVGELQKLRQQVRRTLRNVRSPLEQGIRAANDVRDFFKILNNVRIDLCVISDLLQISVQRLQMQDTRLDGLATCGPLHGPAILLNENTRRRGATADDLERALRFTWAHEIGHLVVDYDQWPALVDAVSQRVPYDVEVRANAFAVTLLLPEEVAYRAWDDCGSPLVWTMLEPLLNEITEKYGLPRIAAARQIAHGAPLERRSGLHQAFNTHIEAYSSSRLLSSS